ncbi:MAG: enoyl-CoA hydratase/carnithine racemase [Desulforhopalus sp.]|jgi:enoyl-CoA hydratase/carnithine racemase
MAAEAYQDITVEYESGVAKIRINRPDKLNAIRLQTYRELISAFQAADESPKCHVIVLSGEGGKFSAGNDLADLTGDDHSQLMECVQGIFTTVSKLKKVLVAAVDGVAVGIGTTILLHCDIAIASHGTKFRLPFVNLGVGPEGGSSVLLPHVIGQKMAREVLFTGRFFSAEEALDWGLINRLVEPEKMVDVVAEYTSLLLKQPLLSLLATKALMRESRPDVEELVARELKMFGSLLQTDETQKRINSFIR